MIATPLAGNGQQPGSADATTEKATIQALLAEVRQLRLALERSTSVGLRIQLGVQRIQLQQDRVNRLSKQYQDCHSTLTSIASNKSQMAADLKRGEAVVGQEQDPARRKQIEMELSHLSADLERLGVREQQEQAQEIQLASQLQAEQAKLNDLSDQLDALDKKLQQEQPTPGSGVNQR